MSHQTTTTDPEEIIGLLEDCFERGASPAEAVDYLAVEKFGRSQSEWARVRDRRRPTITENVSKAKRKMPKSHVVYCEDCGVKSDPMTGEYAEELSNQHDRSNHCESEVAPVEEAPDI